jgi:mycothiol synthase
MSEPVPSEPAVVGVRSDDDLAAMVDVRRRAEPHRPPPLLENLRHNLAGNSELTYLVASMAGSPVGCGFVDVSVSALARAHVLVVPDSRRHGVGTALLAAVAEHAKAARRAEVEGSIRADDESAIAYFARRGFEEVGAEQALALDLATASTAAPQLPEDIRIVSRAEHSDVVRELYDVACEAEPDIPGADAMRSFELWRAGEIDRPTVRPEFTFIALEGNEVVGYAVLDTLGEETWHRLTGVRRAWRRRGIGTALKQAQIRAAKEAGLLRLVTSNEERNVPMRRINAMLGYRPEPSLSTIVMRGPVSSLARARD